MTIYDRGGIKVRICPDDFLNISVGGKHVFITPEEMAEAVKQYLETEEEPK